MAKRKRKTLPRNFEKLFKEADIDQLKSVFDDCDVNAYGGVLKLTAPGFNDCPDELTRWLVEQGADLAATNDYGETPLHARAGNWRGRIEVLLELGADVHAVDQRGNTPLHDAADVGHVANAKLLIEYGADVFAENIDGLTPLAYALQRCSNTKIAEIADVAELLLQSQAEQQTESVGLISRFFGSKKGAASSATSEMKDFIQRIGTEFEFHRSNFNPDMLDAQSAGLEKLYSLFEVEPVPRRAMHDGKSEIITTARNPAEQHDQLWELLVPSSGAAETVQGEVIRVSGRIHDELERNGGVNWNRDYRKMADAYLGYIAMGKPLPDESLKQAAAIVSDINNQQSDTVRLCTLAVEWVSLNPKPLKLPTPDYRR